MSKQAEQVPSKHHLLYVPIMAMLNYMFMTALGFVPVQANMHIVKTNADTSYNSFYSYALKYHVKKKKESTKGEEKKHSRVCMDVCKCQLSS